MTQETRGIFRLLEKQSRTKSIEDRYALITFLQSLIGGGDAETFEDVGFCYWNISDQYALLRDGDSVMRNHQRLYEHISQGDAPYLYWLVCDATQRLTLEKDGYGDQWWSWYREAVTFNEVQGSAMEFQVHRAALYKSPVSELSADRFCFVKKNFETFLSKTKGQEEYPFYYAVYRSLLARYETVEEAELCHLGRELMLGLAAEKSISPYLIGEWGSFVTPFAARKRAEVGLNAVINALIDTRYLQSAKVLYTDAVATGMPQNTYIEKRL